MYFPDPSSLPCTPRAQSRHQNPIPQPFAPQERPSSDLTHPHSNPSPLGASQDPDPGPNPPLWRPRTATSFGDLDAIGGFLGLSVDSIIKILVEGTSGGRKAACKLVAVRVCFVGLRGSLPIAACTFGRAHRFGLHRTLGLLYFPVSDVSRALLHMLLPVRVRVPRGGVPDGHDVKKFVRCKCHHDIRMGGDMLICANQFLKRATVRPRRVEQMKEILTRISW